MAAAELKTATLFAALASVLGPLAAEYSLVLSGAVIGSAIATSIAPKMPKLTQAMAHFLAGLLAAVGCSLLFAIPLSALAAKLSVDALGMTDKDLLFSVAGLIGLFWRAGLRLMGGMGAKLAAKFVGGHDS